MTGEWAPEPTKFKRLQIRKIRDNSNNSGVANSNIAVVRRPNVQRKNRRKKNNHDILEPI